MRLRILTRMPGQLYTPMRPPGAHELLGRSVLVVVLIVGVTVIVYFEGGLVDSQTGEAPGFLDSLYFALVTITTVGYGDIVPVDTASRLIDAFVLTPIRFLVIFTILGTAYQFAFRRFREEYHMRQVIGALDGHVMLCGYGATGHAALEELLLHKKPEEILVIDTREEALEEAAEKGVICFAGDATREHTLRQVAGHRAEHVLVSPGRDDTAVLITLTVRAINPEATVIAMCHESENVKLLERAGAHRVVHPAFAGGALMAAATRQTHLVETMTDLLSSRGALRLSERTAQPDEVGRPPHELRDIAVVRLYRGGKRYDLPNLPEVAENDVLVYLHPTRS